MCVCGTSAPSVTPPSPLPSPSFRYTSPPLPAPPRSPRATHRGPGAAAPRSTAKRQLSGAGGSEQSAPPALRAKEWNALALRRWRWVTKRPLAAQLARKAANSGEETLPPLRPFLTGDPHHTASPEGENPPPEGRRPSVCPGLQPLGLAVRFPAGTPAGVPGGTEKGLQKAVEMGGFSTPTGNRAAVSSAAEWAAPGSQQKPDVTLASRWHAGMSLRYLRAPGGL